MIDEFFRGMGSGAKLAVAALSVILILSICGMGAYMQTEETRIQSERKACSQ